MANFLDILVDFPILRQIDLAAFPTFSVDKVAMAILNTLRRTLKLYTPALLPEEKEQLYAAHKQKEIFARKPREDYLKMPKKIIVKKAIETILTANEVQSIKY